MSELRACADGCGTMFKPYRDNHKYATVNGISHRWRARGQLVRVSVDQAAVLEEMRGAMQRTGSERRKLAVGELVEILQQSNGKAVSRRDLASMLRLPDRTVRALVEQARRQGVPIISPPGYRLALTMAELEAERQALRERALAILATVGALALKGPAWLLPEKQASLPGLEVR